MAVASEFADRVQITQNKLNHRLLIYQVLLWCVVIMNATSLLGGIPDPDNPWVGNQPLSNADAYGAIMAVFASVFSKHLIFVKFFVVTKNTYKQPGTWNLS